ncbi:MAG: protein jag, partial [Sulfurimonas sp.]|nr:protein jag [Sulfurimonas sp.]
HNILNDTIMPESFVSMQDDDDYDMADIHYTADYEEDELEQKKELGSARAFSAYEVAKRVEKEINELFALICFKIDKIEVSAYDEATLLVEFKGEDAALLIGKEGYRYKALSYMIFNWVNTKYQLQLRLEIAEFLKNQEESVARYLVAVCENVDRDGRAQTKILDGVLIQIALKELRDKYPNKYVAVRSTREGLKFIIINDYHN